MAKELTATHVYDNTTGCEMVVNSIVVNEDCMVTEGNTVCIHVVATDNGTPIPGATIWIWHTASGYSPELVCSGTTDSSGRFNDCYILTSARRHYLSRGTVHASMSGAYTPKFKFRMEESPCVTTCETACQDVCETICQVGCEVGCEAACEVSCKTTCELYCQTGCEVTCQTVCEVSCEAACEISCETGCEVSCETGCEVSCETGCEVTCETATEVPTCDQLVKVVDPALNPIEGASVVVSISATESALCYTGADGFCYITGLTIDRIYTACASKAGYEHYGADGCKGFTACTPIAVLLTLHKPCAQGFGVSDQDGNPIEGATVTVTPGDKTCTTNATGWCEVGLSEGLYYNAEARKDGYECFDSECRQDNFVCVPYSSLPLKLREIVRPYTITITVNDENGNPIEGAYVAALKQISELFWEDIDCHDVDDLFVGKCTIDEFKGRNNLLKTNSSGIVKIGLDTLPGASMRYGFHAGRPGYLNESYHEDWSEKFETTRRQGENGEGEYNFVFTLTKITEVDKFIVHTVGLKIGDVVQCQRAYAWSKCFITVPLSMPVFKAPDAYPDGKVEFTTADGLKEGETYGIGPRIAGAILPMGPVWCGVFKGIKEITMPRYGAFGFACSLMGMDPAGDDCRRFWAEMLDPVYCANCITGVLTGKDVHGAEYHPGTFELAMFPVVVVCSFIPWLPGAKITKSLGRLFKKASKYGDNLADVRKYYEDDYLDIYRIQVYGDDVRLEKWAKALDEGNVAEARRIQADIIANPAVGMTDAKAVDNFNSWLDELEKQIDNIDPKQVDEIADQTRRVRGTAAVVLAGIGKFDLMDGSGKRLAALLNDNWDGAFKLARRATPEDHFFRSFEIVKYGKSLDGTPMTPEVYDYAMVLTAFNKTNKVGDFSKTGLLLGEAAAHADESIQLAVRNAFSEDRFWRFWLISDDVSKEAYVVHIAKGELAEASSLLDGAAGMNIASRNVVNYADELEDALPYLDRGKLDNMVESLTHTTYRARLDDLSGFPELYGKLLDDAYPAYIDTLRYGDMEKNVMVFVKAADGLCSPVPWHCKFSFVNALGEVTVGAEKVNLWDVTAVLHKQGLLDETKYVYKNIIKAFAHADESQIRTLRLALEAENHDEVIRLLNDLPRVDMEGRLIARFFNTQRVKALDKWADQSDEILSSSRFLDEEIDEIAGIAENDILWYRFAKTADTRENLFINMLRNASRGPEVISPAGRSAFTSLSFNNGEAVLEALRRISDKDYMSLSRKLGPATEEGKLLDKLKRLQVCIDDGTVTIPAGTDVDTWVRIEIREAISGISPSQYGGPWPELANQLTGEFPTMTPDRIVAECSMLTDDFKAAEGGVQWGRVRAAGVSKLTSEGYTIREAELLIDGKISLYMKELTKKPFVWAIDHPLKAAGAVLGIGAAAYAYVTFGFWIVWYYEELPQMTSMPMYMAVKNENWLLAAEIWVANRATIGDLESKAKMVKLIWPLWADWLDTCIEAHKASNKAYLYMIDPSAPMPKLPEGQNGHVLDVIDSDTIWSGMPDSKLEEMIEYTKAHDPQATEPKVDAFIPPTLTIRFAGVNGPDKGDVGGYWIHRIATIGGEPEIAETTGDCYTNANTDTYTKLSRKDIFILSDENNQWETFRKGRICRFIAVIRHGDPYKYASEELIRSGWGKVYFHDANKQVGISKYLTIETTAKTANLGLWSPTCIPCPATDVWFDYNPPPRVGVETIFYGWVSGCELSEITDWKWVFPGGVTKEGRIVKHTFNAEWKGPIRLEICAGALTESREVTVKKAYPNKASPCAPYGDVNDDGYVNDLDGKLVSDYVDLGWDAVKDDVGELTEPQFIDRADVSKSGEVDISDVDLIYAYHAGTTKTPHFPVCPEAPPSVTNVMISATPPSPVDVGTTVTFVGTAETTAPYIVDSWTWKITDPVGTETTKSGKTITHLFGVAGTWSVVLTACNNTVPANCSSKTKTMKVETYVPPPPKGNLTIKTYATRDFATADPLGVETFYIDGATVAGTYSCTKSNLLVSENPHMVKIDFKEAPHTCYVDTLDECFDTCEFGIDVVADVTTVVQVCPARSSVFSSNCYATIYVKPEGTPDSEYEEVSGAHLMPLGTYAVKYVKPGYSTVVGYITVGNSGVVCENVSTPPTGVCYSTLPPEPVVTPGIYASGFVIKGLLKALPTKTVTFDSGPVGAVVTVLD